MRIGQAVVDHIESGGSAVAEIADLHGNRLAGEDRQAWEQIYREKRKAFVTHLASLPVQGLSKSDERAVVLMRASLSDFPENASTLLDDPKQTIIAELSAFERTYLPQEL